MKELSPKTKILYEREIQIFRDLQALGPDQVKANLARCKLSTRIRRIELWNRFCGADLLKPREVPTFDPRHIPSRELDRFKQFISAYCNEDEKLFIDLGLRMGLRISEILSLNRSSLRESAILVKRKGGREQILPCPSDIYERLESLGGLKFGRGHYQSLMRRISKLIGIKVTPHSLRHTFATELVREHADVAVLSKAMGHSNINTTMKYVFISPEQLRSIIK